MRFLQDKLRICCELLDARRMQTVSRPKTIRFAPCGYENAGSPPSQGWAPWQEGQRVRGRDAHFWFEFEICTPPAQRHCKPALSVVTGREGLWDASNPQLMIYLDGVYAGAMDVNHTTVALEPDRAYRVGVYYYVGMHEQDTGFEPSVVLLDEREDELYYDLWTPFEGAKLLDPNTEEYVKTMAALERAVNQIDFRQIGSDDYYRSLEAARDCLKREFYEKLCGKSPIQVVCVGHSHIDVAWKWTLAQTREKAQRTFFNMAQLMQDYPEFVFQSSQPQLYAFVKKTQPELYARIRKLVERGNWEVEGAMWLEADCNLISGESFVRQILHGKRFMKQEFGVESRVLWLPDVFGYSAALPQILKKSGVEYFVTSKISWNEFNKMPFDTFLWQGIDGTEILTNFITAQDASPDGEPENFTTYNGKITPSMVLGTWNRYQQKAYNDQALLPFGFGDGGGGPTRQMLQVQRRTSYGLPGLPRTVMGKTTAFLDHCRDQFEDACRRLGRTPRWVGELYLEFHRGTYTSIAKNKRSNRKSELLMAAAEGLGTAAHRLLGLPYDAQAYRDCWETILLNQFHDIIPGSSIEEVYQDSDRDYARVAQAAQTLRDGALEAVAGAIGTDGGVLCVNPLGFERRALARVDGVLCDLGMVPAMGWRVQKPVAQKAAVEIDGRCIRNRFFEMTLDEAGRIDALVDLRCGRQVFLPGEKGNQWEAYEDFPRQYDAWEITDYYKQKRYVMDTPAQITPVSDGCRAGFEVRRRYLNSEIVQQIWLYDQIARIDFETRVDWHEHHQLIKAAFPFNVHANFATYEIQFGHIRRETHFNHSWEQAKFEVCGHKWADISEQGYGVSLLNDCKYGFSAQGSTLWQTLLKCASDPNPNADQGMHRFTYLLFPHEGSFQDAGAIEQAYCLNQPVLAAPVPAQKGSLPDQMSFIQTDAAHFVIETVKMAEDGDGVIVRGYESHDRRGMVRLRPGFAFAQAVLCDLMENELETLCVQDGAILVPVRNFEIITVKIR